ncbi:MAG: hypothetical protein AAGF97_20145 [Planctomycetota bacterium]
MGNGLVKIASGHYTATIGPTGGASQVALGQIEGLWRFQTSMRATDVQAHQWGEMTVDGIYQGLDGFILATFKEWDTNHLDHVYWPWSDTVGHTGELGRCMTDLSRHMIFTAGAGTPAATYGPATVTCPFASYAPNHSMEWPLGIAERLIPIVFRLYPQRPSGQSDLTLSNLELLTIT